MCLGCPTLRFAPCDVGWLNHSTLSSVKGSPLHADNIVVLFNEDDVDIPAVCVDRHVVLRQVMVDDAAQPMVSERCFVQGRIGVKCG